MKRDPSIHIRLSDFRYLLETFGEVNRRNICDFFNAARKLSCDERAIVPVKTNQKQVKALTSSPFQDAIILADILYASRVKARHLGATKIKTTDTQWSSVKELAGIINEWAQRESLQKREAYILFVETGMRHMAKSKRVNYNFMASNLVSKASNIIQDLTDQVAIRQDPNPTGTKEIHDLYVREVAERSGIYQKYDKDPSSMAHFIKAREQADEAGAPYDLYIEAQFWALDFCNGIPNIQHLYGQKGTERLIKYLSENQITLKPKPVADVNWSQFK